MSGGGNDTSTKFDPPDWTASQYPAMTDAVMGLMGREAPDYQGMRVAPMNAYQQGAGQLITDRALYGDPQTNTARGSLMSISQGDAMNPYASNPYTDAMIKSNADNMVDAYQNGQGLNDSLLMARKGAFGGSADLEKKARGEAGLAKNVGEMANNVRFGQNNLGAQLWNQDVGNMMQASSMAPQFSMLDSQSFDQMGRYGGQLQNQLQSELGMSYDTYMDRYNFPMTMADWGMGALNRLSGGFGQNYQTGGGQSGGMNALGGLLGAYGMMQ